MSAEVDGTTAPSTFQVAAFTVLAYCTGSYQVEIDWDYWDHTRQVADPQARRRYLYPSAACWSEDQRLLPLHLLLLAYRSGIKSRPLFCSRSHASLSSTTP